MGLVVAGFDRDAVVATVGGRQGGQNIGLPPKVFASPKCTGHLLEHHFCPKWPKGSL
jgi:hypothetical protein